MDEDYYLNIQTFILHTTGFQQMIKQYSGVSVKDGSEFWPIIKEESDSTSPCLV